jgi:hypothetical protein
VKRELLASPRGKWAKDGSAMVEGGEWRGGGDLRNPALQAENIGMLRVDGRGFVSDPCETWSALLFRDCLCDFDVLGGGAVELAVACEAPEKACWKLVGNLLATWPQDSFECDFPRDQTFTTSC